MGATGSGRSVTASGRAESLRVGLLGYGAIGKAVARTIDDQAEPRSLELTAIASRFSHETPPGRAVDVAAIGQQCDVVVEAAGPSALRAFGSRVLEDGADLLVVSIGALLDADLWRRLTTATPGRLLLCSGAVGGLDMLAAARLYGPINRISLSTTKPSTTLVRDWMDDEMRGRLASGRTPVECFRGSVTDAVRLFPESLNVAAALALTAGDPDLIDVTVTGSPTATGNQHDIRIASAAGEYRFTMANHPAPDNPRTSHVTAWAVVRSLQSRALKPGAFV